MFENIRSLISGQNISIVQVEGDSEITRIEYVPKVEKGVNQVLNLFDLLGFEIRSDTVELFNGSKYIGRGYVADTAGITVNVDRVLPMPAPSSEITECPKEPAAAPGLYDTVIGQGLAKIRGIGKDTKIKPAWLGGSERSIPCVVLEGSPKVTIIRFEYLREIEGAIIDDDRGIRYACNPNHRIEIKMPDGKTGPGYVCDPTGTTIRISRDIRIQKKVTKVKDGKEIEETVTVNVKFAGAIAKLSAGDRLPKLLSGISGRENLLQMGIAFAAGLIIAGVM